MIPHSVVRGVDRRVWVDCCDRSGTYGVLTAADETMSLEIVTMVWSLRAHDATPIQVFDLGLTLATIEELTKHPEVTVVKPQEIDLPAEGDHWQAWWKPALLEQSPYDFTVWLDADCIVLKPLNLLFSLLIDVPVLTADHLSPDLCDNDPQLYQRHPVEDQAGVPVNSGVIGLRKGRDDALLRSWSAFVEVALGDAEILSMINWWDQGALNWAIRKHGLSHLIICDRSWNRPARRLLYSGDLTKAIAEAHPDDNIVHFAGPDKLSRLITNCARRDPPIHQHRLCIVGIPRSGIGRLARAITAAAPDYSISTQCPSPDQNKYEEWATTWPTENFSLLIAYGSHLANHLRNIIKKYPETKIIVMVRDSVQIAESRLREGYYWKDELCFLPVFLQQELRIAQIGPVDEPTPPVGLGLLESHVHEIVRATETLTKEVSRADQHKVMVCNYDSLPTAATAICRFLDLNIDKSVLQANLYSWKRPPSVTGEWAINMVKHHVREIRDYTEPAYDRLLLQIDSERDRFPLSYR